MDHVKEVERIAALSIDKHEKIKLLESIEIDLKNEMEAEDQNMHPEIKTRLGVAYQLANDHLIKLRQQK